MPDNALGIHDKANNKQFHKTPVSVGVVIMWMIGGGVLLPTTEGRSGEGREGGEGGDGDGVDGVEGVEGGVFSLMTDSIIGRI